MNEVEQTEDDVRRTVAEGRADAEASLKRAGEGRTIEVGGGQLPVRSVAAIAVFIAIFLAVYVVTWAALGTIGLAIGIFTGAIAGALAAKLYVDKVAARLD
jgi:hypothetical protein